MSGGIKTDWIGNVSIVDGNGDALGTSANPQLVSLVGASGTSIIDLTFSLDTAIHAAGDVLAATQELAGAVSTSGGAAVLHSIVLNDKDDQGLGIDVVFLKTNVSIGTENAAVSISDTNADEVLGIVSVSAADFIDLGGCRVATVRSIGLPVEAGSGSTSIYVALITRGTPTHTASGITAKFGFI